MRHQRDLERASIRLEQAYDQAGRVASKVRDLQSQLDDLPRWSRSRRQALTRTLTFTTDTVLPGATHDLLGASSDVDALTHLVDTDTRERVDNATADRERRRTAWVGRSERPYTDPNAVPASADHAKATAAHRGRYGRDPYPTQAPRRGPARSM
jgi:hypothetical protein